MSNTQKLKKIAQEIETCIVCKEGSIGMPVAGEGNPDASIMIIGEAPGKQEALSGRPFVGRSGKLLRDHLITIDIQPESCFITSVCKYLPVRGTPTTSQITHSRTHILKQLEIIHPRLVLLLGATACLGIEGEVISIQKQHGHVITHDRRYDVISYHPAAVLRNPSLRPTFIEDFQTIKALVREKQIL